MFLELSPIAASLLTGAVTAIITVTVNRVEIKHLWSAIRRHEKVHDKLWTEVGKKST